MDSRENFIQFGPMELGASPARLRKPDDTLRGYVLAGLREDISVVIPGCPHTEGEPYIRVFRVQDYSTDEWPWFDVMHTQTGPRVPPEFTVQLYTYRINRSSIARIWQPSGDNQSPVAWVAGAAGLYVQLRLLREAHPGMIISGHQLDAYRYVDGEDELYGLAIGLYRIIRYRQNGGIEELDEL